MDRILIILIALVTCGYFYFDGQSTKEELHHATNQATAMAARMDQDQQQIADLTHEVNRSHAELADLQARLANIPQTPTPQSWLQKRVQEGRTGLDR